MIYFEEEFRHYTRQLGIKRDYISNLHAVLTYTSHTEISPSTITKFSDLKTLEAEIINNRKKVNPEAAPEHYAKDCISALRKYMQFINSHTISQNAWVMALGEKSFNLEQDFKDGTISIGWEELGDLRLYPSKEAIEQRLVEILPNGNQARTNDRLACYEFAHRMQIGDLVFIRHGVEDIVGYGYVEGDYIFNPSRKLHSHTRKFNWVSRGEWHLKTGKHAQKTLTEIAHDFPEYVIQFKRLVGLNEISTVYPDTLPPQTTYEEGSKLTTLVNAYERNPEARQKCIEYHKPICKVCEFDFEQVFGQIGQGFIHVHHLKELRDIGQSYHVDPIKDLAPVCPNCHAMLHKRRPAYSIEEMRTIRSKKTNNNAKSKQPPLITGAGRED